MVECHARVGRRRAGLGHASTTEMLVRRCLTPPRLVRDVLVGVFAWLYRVSDGLPGLLIGFHVVLRKILAQIMLVSRRLKGVMTTTLWSANKVTIRLYRAVNG